MPEIVNVEQAAAWDGPSGDAWVAREAFQNEALAGHTERMLAAAAIAPTDHVLDVGCGTGDTTRAAARARRRRRRPRRRPLPGDARPGARARASADGLANVGLRTGRRAGPPLRRRRVRRGHQPLRRDVLRRPRGRVRQPRPRDRARRPARGRRLAAVLAATSGCRCRATALALGRQLPPIPEDVPGMFGLADADRVRRILDDARLVRRAARRRAGAATTTAPNLRSPRAHAQ